MYSTASTACFSRYNANVSGSTTRQLFTISPLAGCIWDVTRLIFHIEDNAAMDDGTFGVAIRLNGNLGESLQFIIQDNLTTLAKFYIIAQGHVVEE